MRKILIESQLLPPIEFFSAICKSDELILERHENFQKQTYRNRFQILGANQVLTLTVPVIKANSKTLMRDLKIDHSQRWASEHWRSLKSAYGKAPFFEFFEPDLKNIFDQTDTFLIDLNHRFLTLCLKILGISPKVTYSETYNMSPELGVTDLRSQIHPKKSYSDRSFYRPYPYLQVFGKDFAPNLSILDLLMNEGSNALHVVTKSKMAE